MEKLFKKTGYITIIASIVFCFLGILLICYSDAIVAIVSYVIGGILVGVGALKIITYFTDKYQREFFNYNLATGIIASVIGICVITFAQEILFVFKIIISVWIIYSGIVRLNLAMELKKVDTKAWLPVLVISILMILSGLFIIAYDGIITTTIGVIMIIYSIMDIVEGVIYTRNVDKLFREI